MKNTTEEEGKTIGEYNKFIVAKDVRYYRIPFISRAIKSAFKKHLRNKQSMLGRIATYFIVSKEISLIKQYTETGKKSILEALIKSGIVLEHSYKRNIIPTVGRNVLARRLAGDTTYTGEIDYGAIGTGVSPTFTNASTQLSSEQYRSQADSQAYDDNIAYIDWFIASGDVADDTYTEFGAFIDGTGAADSGQAFSLLATGGWVKSGSMFISAKYTLV